MVNSKRFSLGRRKTAFFLWLFCFGTIVDVQGEEMSLAFSKDLDASYQLKLQPSDLLREISLNEAIGEILCSDLNARKSILDAKIPDELSDREFSEKLIDYASVQLVKDAERLEQLYRSGDKVWAFESKSSQQKSKGFLLMRNGEVLHLVIIELIVI